MSVTRGKGSTQIYICEDEIIKWICEDRIIRYKTALKYCRHSKKRQVIQNRMKALQDFISQ